MPAKRKTTRRLKAHLGVIATYGIKPVISWVEDGRIFFHKLHDRQKPRSLDLCYLYKLTTKEEQLFTPEVISVSKNGTP